MSLSSKDVYDEKLLKDLYFIARCGDAIFAEKKNAVFDGLILGEYLLNFAHPSGKAKMSTF